MARLGELERAVMEVLWAVPGPLTAREVVAALEGRDLAYTTVLTVLSRLEKKAVVRRARAAGRAYAYRPVSSREEHTAELMRAALDAAGDRVAALARFVGSVSPEEAAVLRRALDGMGRAPADGGPGPLDGVLPSLDRATADPRPADPRAEDVEAARGAPPPPA